MNIGKYHIQLIFISVIAVGVVPFYKILGIFGNGWWHYVGYSYIAGCIGIMLMFAKFSNWTAYSLGFRIDNMRKSILPYAIFTGCWVIAIMGIGFLLHKGFDPNWSSNIHFTGMFLVSAALQQFFFSSLLIRLQKEVFKNNFLLTLYNALIFSLIHLSFDRHALTITLIAYALGMGFAAMYLKYTNYFLITLSHAVINVVGTLIIYG